MFLYHTWSQLVKSNSPHLGKWNSTLKLKKKHFSIAKKIILYVFVQISFFHENMWTSTWIISNCMPTLTFFLPIMSLKNVKLHNNYTKYVVSGREKKAHWGAKQSLVIFFLIMKQMQVEFSIASGFLFLQLWRTISRWFYFEFSLHCLFFG